MAVNIGEAVGCPLPSKPPNCLVLGVLSAASVAVFVVTRDQPFPILWTWFMGDSSIVLLASATNRGLDFNNSIWFTAAYINTGSQYSQYIHAAAGRTSQQLSDDMKWKSFNLYRMISSSCDNAGVLIKWLHSDVSGLALLCSGAPSPATSTGSSNTMVSSGASALGRGR